MSEEITIIGKMSIFFKQLIAKFLLTPAEWEIIVSSLILADGRYKDYRGEAASGLREEFGVILEKIGKFADRDSYIRAVGEEAAIENDIIYNKEKK